MSTSYNIFVSVTPGLEEALQEEIHEHLPGHKLELRPGGISLRGKQEELWRLSVLSRMAERVRVRIGRFKARNFQELEAGLKRLPWAAYLAKDTSVHVDVSAKKSALYHSKAIAERAERVLARPTPGPNEAQTRVWLRLRKDWVTLSVDAGGGLLHRRGWRQYVGRAPIRETLAAACLRLSGIGEGQPLWDPFCGSGTFLIEAALSRSAIPCQLQRRFAFQDWPTSSHDLFSVWQSELPKGALCEPMFWGSDICGQTLEGAKANAERAGVGESCHWMQGDFTTHVNAIPEGAAVVSNLPYGKRLKGGKANKALFRRFAELLASRPDLGPVVVLNGSNHFVAESALEWSKRAAFSNRGTPTQLLALKSR